MKDRGARRAWLLYLAVVGILAVVAAARHREIHVAVLLVAWAVALGWPTLRILSSNMPRAAAWLAAGVVGYHALFGPAMLLHLATHAATRNDDLALRLWPHLIRWINSLE